MILLTKTPAGSLIPADDAAQDRLRAIKAGATVRAEIAVMRNAGFHRKYFALLKIGFDVWSELVPEKQYKGIKVLPNFERFRKDVAILAGHYEPVFNARNEVRLEADSISFANMDQDEFEALFSKTIDVMLQNILPASRYTEAQLRELVEKVMEFA